VGVFFNVVRQGENLYADFGKVTSTNIDGDLYENRNRLHMVRFGVNLQF